MKKEKKDYNIIIINTIIIMFVLIDLYGLFSLYKNYTDILDNNIQAVEDVKDVSFYLQSIDNNILYSINKINNNPTSDINEYINKVDTCMNKCAETIQHYQSMDVTNLEKQRFNLFSVYFQSYQKKVDSILNTISTKNGVSAQAIYTQELLPVKNCIIEILDAINDLSTASSRQHIEIVNRNGIFIGIGTFIISIILLIVINFLDRKQKLSKVQLLKQNETINKQNSTIQEAVFKDTITEAHNRMTFLLEFSDNKKTLANDESGYFLMFNIDGFHRINFNYGNNVGDIILNETVTRLSNIFNENRIYRTGSDEFVILVKTPSGSESYNKIISLINNAKISLAKPYQLNPGVVNLSCSISCVYVNGPSTLESNLLETASEAIKQGRMNGYGNTTFINTENNQNYILNM